MAGSTISGTITSTVTLGSANYPSPLTVTSTGDVAISFYGATGIFGPAGSGTLINDGNVTGGVGSAGSGFIVLAGNGGIGVDLLSGTTATNNGTITGGTGGAAGDGANGGVGVYLAAGAALTNEGSIAGGAGGASIGGPFLAPGSGADGVLVKGGSLTNSGTIAGGDGPYSNLAENQSGRGVDLLAGTVTNTGTIIGGSKDLTFGRGAIGVYLAASATLLNSGGTIIGGDGAKSGVGVFVAAGGTLTIAGVIIGGHSGNFGGGEGVELAGGGSLDNTGTVIGGSGIGGTGIYLAKGGTLTNAATIVGGAGIDSFYTSGGGPGGSGVSLANDGVVINAAFISGGSAEGGGRGAMGGDGVDLIGTLTNGAGAMIIGGAGGYGGDASYSGGAGVSVGFGTVTNAGTIIGGSGIGIVPSNTGGNGGTGVSLSTRAVLTNTGSIGGGSGGYDRFGDHGGTGVVMGATRLATLTNSGLITGGNGDNVAPGSTNALNSPFTVSGGAGAYVGSDDTLTNAGTIVAGAGVFIGAGGAFDELSTISTGGAAASITGGAGASIATGGTLINTGTVISGVGVYLAAGATLITGGTVAGGIYAGVTADAVQFAAAGTLVLDPGAAFIGQVAGHAGSSDTLYLAYYGSHTGTLAGLGTQFTDFSQIAVGTYASWTLTGANTIGSGATLVLDPGASLTDTGTLVNYGAITLDPSTLTVAGLTGTGSVAIDAASALSVQTTIATGETLTFSGSGGYVHLGTPDDVAGSVTNFSIGDTIDLQGIDISTVSYSTALGQLMFGGGGFALALAPDGGSVSTAASADGTEVFSALCFCANTQILTPQGERAVQDLAVGDLVTTHRGEARPIVWIGEGRVRVTRGQRGAATPVIVRRGALAENVPHRDLRVTKGHSLWFGGGVLIPVEYLVNHRLIEWDDRAQEVSLYHVELASHDVLVANGAPAESYRDDGNRWLFENANSGWEQGPCAPCAPVLTGGAVVDVVWRRLLRRAGARPGFALTDDPDLHLVVDGRRVDAGARRGAAYVFALAGCGGSSVRAGAVRPGSVRIVSRAAAPAELGLARDPRVLGVAVRSVALRQGARFRVVEAAALALAEGGGFYPFEPGDGVRWTDGDAVLPAGVFSGFEGAVEVVVHVGGTMRYPLIGARAGEWGCGVAA